jgi:SAM-dependent methyltransferase
MVRSREKRRGPVIRKLARLVLEHVRVQGWRMALEGSVAVLIDVAFDWRYGTDTLGWLEPEEIPVSDDARSQMTRYAPTRARALRKLLLRLALPQSMVFIDIGCGRGRAMLVAAALGFREIYGVEFVPQFVEQARRNIAVFRKRLPANVDIRVVDCNAVDYVFPPRDSVIYIFDPFSERVLSRVLDNLRSSLRDCPRRIRLIYADLPFPGVVEAAGIFKHVEDYDYGGHRFSVFTNCTGPIEPL